MWKSHIFETCVTVSSSGQGGIETHPIIGNHVTFSTNTVVIGPLKMVTML